MIDDINGTTKEEMEKYLCPFLCSLKEFHTSDDIHARCWVNRCAMWKWLFDGKRGVCLQRLKKERQ
jgi:hypothetical protein